MPGFVRIKESYDFLIVGGGHAGLQAALKAALLGFSALVVDRGPKYSRSYYAPKMDNIPGFPDGVSGPLPVGASAMYPSAANLSVTARM